MSDKDLHRGKTAKELTMKDGFLLLTMLCMGLLLCGCERRQPSEESPEIFDPKTDPPASVLGTNPDLSLLGDQAVISRRIERGEAAPALPVGATPAPAAPSATSLPVGLEAPSAAGPAPRAAGGGIVDQVKQKVGEIVAAVRSGQIMKATELYRQGDAETIRPILGAAMQMREKTIAFEELVRQKLGLALSNEIRSSLAERFSGAAVGPLGTADPSNLTFEQSGASVTVTAPSGEKIEMVQSGSDWVASSLPAQLPNMLKAHSDLVSGQTAFLDAMSSAVEQGQVTAETFPQRANEMIQQTISPALNALMAMEYSNRSASGASTSGPSGGS